MQVEDVLKHHTAGLAGQAAAAVAAPAAAVAAGSGGAPTPLRQQIQFSLRSAYLHPLALPSGTARVTVRRMPRPREQRTSAFGGGAATPQFRRMAPIEKRLDDRFLRHADPDAAALKALALGHKGGAAPTPPRCPPRPSSHTVPPISSSAPSPSGKFAGRTVLFRHSRATWQPIGSPDASSVSSQLSGYIMQAKRMSVGRHVPTDRQTPYQHFRFFDFTGTVDDRVVSDTVSPRQFRATGGFHQNT
jgi:hypothetical protein